MDDLFDVRVRHDIERIDFMKSPDFNMSQRSKRYAFTRLFQRMRKSQSTGRIVALTHGFSFWSPPYESHPHVIRQSIDMFMFDVIYLSLI